MAGLTPKQARFVDEYLVSGNATDAYRKAYGGTEAAAAAHGARLVRNGKVMVVLAARRAKVAAKADLTLQSHLDRLNELADQAASAEQFGPAVSAEVSRGKASGFYVERSEVKHKGKVEVTVRFVREGRRVTAS